MEHHDLSETYPGSLNPNHPGIYQVRSDEPGAQWDYAHWENSAWWQVEAMGRRTDSKIERISKWRGLVLFAQPLDETTLRHREIELSNGDPYAALAIARHRAATGDASGACTLYEIAKRQGVRLSGHDLEDRKVVWSTLDPTERERVGTLAREALNARVWQEVNTPLLPPAPTIFYCTRHAEEPLPDDART